MKAVTWQKDSHGLFDYETKSLSVKKYRVDAACKVFRNGINDFPSSDQQIMLADNKQPAATDPNSKYLTQVTANQEGNLAILIKENYFINPGQSET